MSYKYKLIEDSSDIIVCELDILGDECFVVLDFDHTLLLGNSTELFINSVVPQVWGRFIDLIATKIWFVLKKILPFEYDQFRILIITVFAPLTWIRWKAYAKKSSDNFWNEELWSAVKKQVELKKILIISLGFKPIIDPILKHRFSRIENENKPDLIASGLFLSSKSIRSIGKIESVEKILGNSSWDKILSISDSVEDRLLLLKSKVGILAKWNEPEIHKKKSYFPFRYLTEGKYPQGSYLRNSIIGEDLIVWCLLFCTDLRSILPTLLLFFSFQLIYEIGYYENDFLGAKNEINPQLSLDYNEFLNYRISENAWFYSIIIAILSCLLLDRNFKLELFFGWISILIAIRVVYHLYNKQVPERRFTYYCILQAFKYFSGITILFINPVGLILAIVHMFQKCAVYFIYRCGGKQTLFPRVHVRTILFFIGLIIAFFCKVKFNLVIISLALIWLGFQEFIVIYANNKMILKKYKWFNKLSHIRSSIRLLFDSKMSKHNIDS